MNRGDMRDRLSFLLSFNEGQTNQDFSTARLNKLLQDAYQRELNKAKQEGSSAWFKMNYTFTWAASATTLALPDIISQVGIIEIQDITHQDPGPQLQFDNRGGADVRWVDRSTLQWGTSGPAEAKTLRATFLPKAETMVNDDAVPLLIPEEHHELIYWSAATVARFASDEGAPADWKSHVQDLRLDYSKFISKGRPYSDTPVTRLAEYSGVISLVY